MSKSKNGVDIPIVTTHAAERWLERMPSATVGVETAWSEGITVNAPECDCDSAKLYPPEDALLLRKGDRIVTVLPVNYARLDITDLVWCSNCSCATTLQRSWDGCEWCGNRTGTERADGNVRILC